MDHRQIRGDFRTRLANAGDRLGFTVKQQRRQTLLSLSGALNCLIYFKVRTQRSPSASTADWGVTKNTIEEFRESGTNWALVLLQGSAESGYLLTPSQGERYVREGIWYLGKEGDYKVARSRLRYNRPFESFREFIQLLFEQIGQRQAEAGAELVGPPHRTRSEEDFWSLQVKRRETGRRGEEYVKDMERRTLIRAGRRHLAKRVKRISKEDVGAGYDVLSSCPDGREKYIEVKTSLGHMTTFEITAREVEVARQLGGAYWLYLVENVENDPRVTRIQNPGQKFGKEILLEPSAYTARVS